MGSGSTKLTQQTPSSSQSCEPNQKTKTDSPFSPSAEQQSTSKHLTQVHIFFGSSGGTAEQFSQNMKSMLNSKGIPARVVNLDEFKYQHLLACSVALFLVATTGEGEPTENAQQFAEWVANKDGNLPSDYLKNVNYAVFGLGDSTYQYYNQMGKMTHSSLEKLGGNPIYPLVEGDASEDLDHDFENWRESIIPKIKESHENKVTTSV